MLEPKEAKRVRNLLWTWGRIDKQCADLLNDLRALKNLIDDTRGLRGSSVSDGQPRASGVGDPTANTAITVESIIAQFEKSAESTDKEIAHLQGLRRAIDECVASLYPVERDIIRMKYKLGHKMVYIAVRLEIAERTAYNYEESAVEKISSRCSFLQET